jgi:energy-coupling factor transporter transmembrane protein EcfT
MLSNSAAENTGLGILLWLFILVHGIVAAWFWLVFLSGIIIYLARNLKRFGLGFLKSAFGSLTVLAALLFGLIYYVISYEPLTDFRPYAVGSDLKVYLENTEEKAQEKIFVYRDKRTQKELLLSEENHVTSMIWEDTNFVFLRMHDFNIVSGFGAHLQGFNPLLNVNNLRNQEELNSFIQPAYEAYFEDLVEVRNKKNRDVSILKKSEFTAEMEKDTNLLVRKYSGVPADVDFISIQDLILHADLCFVWVVKDLNLISTTDWQKMRELNEELVKQEIAFVVVGSSAVQNWESSSGYTSRDVAYLNLDPSELMKICRSNVCLMILQKGSVAGKYPLSGLPKFETILSKIK